MLSKFLTQRREEIVSRFADKWRALHPNRPVEQIFDMIPEFLDECIEPERRGIAADTLTPLHMPHAREYGAQRFRLGFQLSDIALDFGLVCDVVCELAVERDFHLDPRSYRLLNARVDRAIADSLDAYVEESRKCEGLGAAQLAHELRNSLGAAQLAFGALRAGEAGPDNRAARVLEKNLERLDVLIAETLTSVTLGAGHELDVTRVDVSDLVEHVVHGALIERDIAIEQSIEAGLVINADRNLLESALFNLVQNAIKFTRTGGHVSVRALRIPYGIWFEVEDECGGLHGISPDELFKPYVQRAEHKSGGMGLGLAITRQAIEAHGGRITAEDRAPKGCVFAAWLPSDRNAVGGVL